MLLNQIIKQLRISQWVKNGFVFLPMFFAGQMIDIWCWQQCFVAFLSFSFMASAVYCINDLKDVEADRNHPIKCQRPLPSGKITVLAVRLLTILLIASSLLISGLLKSAWTTAILTIYLVLNIMYCYKLKQYAIIDVFILSMGFVLRLFAGGISCHIVLSPWIVSLTFLIALFLTFAKRRDDVVILDQTGKTMRRNTKRYNIQFLNQTLSIVGTITIVCYIMYTVSDDVMCRFGSRYLYTTSIFVLAGILRYLQLTIVDNRSGSPTKILLKDTFIQVCIGCWILMFIGIIYIYIYI
jgi:4-hydroxybenzoate polyprenyltransferase